MVQLTITTAIIEALELTPVDAPEATGPSEEETSPAAEPSLEHAQVGNPITHGQVVDLWRRLTAAGIKDYSLERLLKGSRVYVPPPPPKAEPVRLPTKPFQRASLN